MKCEIAQEALSAVLDGEASGSRELDDHVASCGRCQTFDRSMQMVRRELRLGIGSSIDVSEAVMASVAEAEASRTGRSEPLPPVPARRRLYSVVATAALVLGAVAAAAFAMGRSSAPSETVLAVDLGDDPLDAPGLVASAQPETDQGAATASTTSAVLMSVWTPGAMDAELIAGMEAMEAAGDIHGLTFVRRATLGLTASQDSTGRPVDVFDDGWMIPLDVVAVDVGEYGGLLASPTIVGLRPDQGVIGSSSAAQRGLDTGSLMTVGGTTIEVAGIVDDAVVGNAELLVGSDTGAALGVTRVRYALLTSEIGQASVENEIAALTDRAFRLSNRRQSPMLRNSDGVLAQVDLKARFGEFAVRPSGTDLDVEPEWFVANIITAELPLVGSVTCHRLVIDALRPALAELEAGGYQDVLVPDRFEGCWNPRLVSGSDDISHHTWGTAVDLVDDDVASRLDPTVVETMERFGFTWGGDWLNADPGHFEFVG